MALPTSASSRSDRREEKKRAWFVSCGDALSNVHRLLWNLPIAWSGRERACHWRKSHLVARDRASFTALRRPLQLPQAQPGDAEVHLTRSGRRNSVFFYGVSPSNPLAFEAAARVRQGHVSSLAESLAKFTGPKQAQSAVSRSGAQRHAVKALQPPHGKDILGLD